MKRWVGWRTIKNPPSAYDYGDDDDDGSVRHRIVFISTMISDAKDDILMLNYPGPGAFLFSALRGHLL